MATAKPKPATTTLANAFIGKLKPPSVKEVSAALGPAKSLWDRLLAELADELNLTAAEWGSSSRKLGWSLRVKQGERIIVYMAPLQGAFRASFVLGDKAVKAALAAGLPTIGSAIKSAKKYAEGTPVRIDVLKQQDLVTVKQVVLAKFCA